MLRQQVPITLGAQRLQPRRSLVRVSCDTSSSEKKLFPLLNSSVAKQRNNTIKDNINRLIAIATNEVKEFNELIKELDLEHKKAFKINQGDIEAQYDNNDKSSPKDGNESDNDENIFINSK